MSNKTDLCNIALLEIGKATVTNIDTDSVQQAEKIRQAYDLCLEQILNEHHWSFATFRTTLPRLSETPAFGYSYKFSLPTNPRFLRLISLEDNVEYTIENDGLYSNSEAVKIKYIGFQNDISKFIPSFKTAFSILLASKVCYTLTGDKTMTNDLIRRYRDIELLNAINQDRSSLKLAPVEKSNWIEARLGNNVNITVNNG